MKISQLNQDFKNTLQTFISRIGVFGIGLFFKIYLARTLTVEDNGVFGKWLALYNYGLIVLGFGLNLSLIYYVNSKLLKENEGFSFNSTFYICITPLLLLTSLIFKDYIYYFSLLLAILVGLLISTLNSIQLIRGKITRFNLTELARNLIIFALFFVYFEFNKNQNLSISYFVYFAALFLTFLIFYFSEKKLSLFNKNIFKYFYKEYFKYGSKGLLLNILGQTLYVFDIFLVEHFAGDYYLGLYIVAGSIARLLWFFVDAAGTVIFPKLIASLSDDSKKMIYDLSKFSFIINVIGVIFFLIFGEYLIRISFGEKYLDSNFTIVILLLASHGMVIYKLINRYLASKNLWRVTYISLVVSLFCNIILNIILIPKFNIVGAAIASLVSYWICGILVAQLSGFSIANLIIGRINIR